MFLHVITQLLVAIYALDHLACPINAYAVSPSLTWLEKKRRESHFMLEEIRYLVGWS